MKKFVSILLVLLLSLSFAACGEEEIISPTEADTQPQENSEVYAVLSPTQAKPGDTVSLSVYLRNVKNLTSIDLECKFDGELATAAVAGGSTIVDFMDQVNIETGYIRYGGLIMTKTDIADNQLFTVDITVDEEAAQDIVFDLTLQNVSVALDEGGEQTQDITSTVSVAPITLHIEK